MSHDNTYQPPTASSELAAARAVRPLRPPYLGTAILLFIGGCFLLLLNGRHFTNTIAFLGFMATSTLL